MEYRRLGRSGLEVSAIGLGTNNFGTRDKWPFHMDPESAAAVVDKALDLGINMIDTANAYGDGASEEHIGKALRGKRHQAIVCTKVWSRMADGPNQAGSSRLHITREVESSLRRLQTDYVDLYQLHAPDPTTPLEETLRTLDDLVHQGKVRYIGCSNFASWQLCEAVWTSRTLGLVSPISEQPRYNMLERDKEAEVIPFCTQYGIGLLPYFPLFHGVLTGKYRRGQPPPKGSRLATEDRGVLTDRNFDLVEKLEDFASKHEKTLLELAFAWLLANPAVSSVIAGATSPQQIEVNARTHEWHLTDDDMTEIDALLTG